MNTTRDNIIIFILIMCIIAGAFILPLFTHQTITEDGIVREATYRERFMKCFFIYFAALWILVATVCIVAKFVW